MDNTDSGHGDQEDDDLDDEVTYLFKVKILQITRLKIGLHWPACTNCTGTMSLFVLDSMCACAWNIGWEAGSVEMLVTSLITHTHCYSFLFHTGYGKCRFIAVVTR